MGVGGGWVFLDLKTSNKKGVVFVDLNLVDRLECVDMYI